MTHTLTTEIAKIWQDIRNINEEITPLEIKRRELRESVDKLQNQVKEEMFSTPEWVAFKKLAEEFDPTYYFVSLDNSDDYRDCHEDDGTLHIYHGKLRACFISNQDISKSEWNKIARPIVKAFGFKWSECSL